MLSDHYKSGMTERLVVQVFTVDRTNNQVEVVGKDAAIIPVGFGRTAGLFRMPKEGELWTMVRENGIWALEDMFPDPADKPLSSLNPGESLVQSETVWTTDGQQLVKSEAFDAVLDAIDDLEAAVTALDARLDTLEAQPRTVFGGITNTGDVNYGTGFSSESDGVGIYTVTFDTPFTGGQYILQFGSDNGNPLAPYYSSSADDGFTVHVVNLAGTHVDAYINFQATG